IVGPARADMYFGAGDVPADIAGRMKHPGKFVMLFPNEVAPAARPVPLPTTRPPADVIAAHYANAPALAAATATAAPSPEGKLDEKPAAKPNSKVMAKRDANPAREIQGAPAKARRNAHKRKPGVQRTGARTSAAPEKSLMAKLGDALKPGKQKPE